MPLLSLSTPLSVADPEMNALIDAESRRQKFGIELIASENFTSRAVMEAFGSCVTNKYAEGQPNARYYGGNEVIDRIELLCESRALVAFKLDTEEWGVNVQPYSGSPANFIAYTAVLQPHDRLMGLHLPSGGHLTHGYQIPGKKISAVSTYFETLPYKVDPISGLIDYDSLETLAMEYRPKLLVCGASAYARVIDFERFRKIADKVGCMLMCDMAHIAGLVAGGMHPSPFPHCDIVTTTTHKSLRGPRAGIIFFRKKHGSPTLPLDMETRVDMACFPGLQGGPHVTAIAAMAVQFAEVVKPEWAEYASDVVNNCKHLAAELHSKGHRFVTGGTDNHLLLWDLTEHGLSGSKFEKICEAVHISVNRNCVPTDKSALAPNGVRIGTCAMTSRGVDKKGWSEVAGFLDRCVKIALRIQAIHGKKLDAFVTGVAAYDEVKLLAKEVEAWSAKWDFPNYK